MKNFSMLHSSVERIALSLAGFFIVFNLFYVALNFSLPTLHRLWFAPYVLLVAPIQSFLASFYILFSMLSLPQSAFHTYGDVISSILSNWLPVIGTDLVLFLAIMIAVALFERRKKKTMSEIIVFYGLIPPVIWLLLTYLNF